MASDSEQTVLSLLLDHWITIATILSVLYIIQQCIVLPLFISPLRKLPGPKLYAISSWPLALRNLKGTRSTFLLSLHQKHGSTVRVGPNEVSFHSLSALRTIYGAGSGFERTSFYRLFDVYGRQNLFTFETPDAHGKRKKLLNHVYSKSAILGGSCAQMIEDNVRLFLQMLKENPSKSSEIFTSMHYFSLDNITQFLYGAKYGGTQALNGEQQSRALLDDIVDPAARQYFWFAVHLTKFTKWLYSRTGILGTIINKLQLLPMKKPTTYTGIRNHALQALKDFEAATDEEKTSAKTKTIMERLWKHSQQGKAPTLDGLDIASEAADHFLAGIDTTSNSIMFAIWALSLPEHKQYQAKLIAELESLPSSSWTEDSILPADIADKLLYLDAVIKETLRLYAPIPSSEPRLLPRTSTIDGYEIPAYTIVSMSPYTLHRNPDVFPDPLKFMPERWLGEYGDVVEMKKWFWAFSSGGRMCIGMHLAMAEMTTLIAAIYRHYTTKVQARQQGISPAFASRFEIFYDEKFDKFQENACWIDFTKRESRS